MKYCLQNRYYALCFLRMVLIRKAILYMCVVNIECTKIWLNFQ